MPERAAPITIYELKITEHPEFGRTVTFNCPDCGEELCWTEYARWLNKHDCKCRNWNLLIEARGLGK